MLSIPSDDDIRANLAATGASENDVAAYLEFAARLPALLVTNMGELNQYVGEEATIAGPRDTTYSLRALDGQYRHGAPIVYHDCSTTETGWAAVDERTAEDHRGDTVGVVMLPPDENGSALINLPKYDAEMTDGLKNASAVELAYTTVTDRETEGTSRATSGASVVETGVWNESRWDQFIWGGTVRETAVIGEWRLGEAVLGSTEGASPFEAILAVMGVGGFPASGKRESLTPGHRRQLRDAMILEAHSRDGRDVLVTQNTTDFIKHGRREQLEALCKTRIMTVDEFCYSVAELGQQT